MKKFLMIFVIVLIACGEGAPVARSHQCVVSTGFFGSIYHPKDTVRLIGDLTQFHVADGQPVTLRGGNMRIKNCPVVSIFLSVSDSVN